jgi:phosphoribosylglycinamide formyltransferase 1
MPNLPIAVFLSGGGRTLENLLRQQSSGHLPTNIRLVISSSSQVRGVAISKAAGIDTRVVLKSKFGSPTSYSDAMFGPCREVGAQLVVMAGFLKHVLIPQDFTGRVINIHPSLIPAFAGEGMYGMNVHEAAIRRGVQFSGCTVHYVDNDYDHGPIILQRICPVPPAFTAEQLADAVFELECEALPEAIRRVVVASFDRLTT